MDKITKLSAAIRYGSTFIGETRPFFGPNWRYGPFTCACAVGTAYLAVIDPCSHYVTGEQIMGSLERRFNVPREVLTEVSTMHFLGKKTRAQCADWLEEQGY